MIVDGMMNYIAAAAVTTLTTYALVQRRKAATRELEIDHVVLLRLKKEMNQTNLIKSIQNLANLVPDVVDVTCGEGYSTKRSNGYTHGLVARIKSERALTVYATHAEHLKVKAEIIKHLTPLLSDETKSTSTPSVIAMDYHSKRITGTSTLIDGDNTKHVSHLVLLCLRPYCDSACRSCQLLDSRLYQGAYNMAKGIPGIVDLTFGRTFTKQRCGGYTHCLNVRFDSKESGELYQPHELHSEFKRLLKGHNTSSCPDSNLPWVCCVDYESSRK